MRQRTLNQSTRHSDFGALF